jgi:hypothetical protein
MADMVWGDDTMTEATNSAWSVHSDPVLDTLMRVVDERERRVGAYLRRGDDMRALLRGALTKRGEVMLQREGLSQHDLGRLYQEMAYSGLLTLTAPGREMTIEQWLFGKSEHAYAADMGRGVVPLPYNFSVPFYRDQLGLSYIWTGAHNPPAAGEIDARAEYQFELYVHLPPSVKRRRKDEGMRGGEMPHPGDRLFLALNAEQYVGPTPPSEGVTVVAFAQFDGARDTGTVTVRASGWR